MRHGQPQRRKPVKEPDHPVGPAFEAARDEDEHKRQQRIAALSAAQRRAFARLERNQEGQEANLRKTQEQRFKGEVAEHMRQKLLPIKEQRLEPKGQGRQFRPSHDLEQAITDYAGGRQARVRGQYRIEVGLAYDVGRRTVTGAHAQERQKLREAHRRERDAFLAHAERARGRSARQAFGDKASSKEQPREAFDKAARDPSFRRAFDRAASREAAREHERESPLKEMSQDRAKQKELPKEAFDKAARDPALARAFDKAARADPANRDGLDRGPKRDGPDLTR